MPHMQAWELNVPDDCPIAGVTITNGPDGLGLIVIRLKNKGIIIQQMGSGLEAERQWFTSPIMLNTDRLVITTRRP